MSANAAPPDAAQRLLLPRDAAPSIRDPAHRGRGQPRRWAILAGLSGLLMAQPDYFIVNAALARIDADFREWSLTAMSWMLVLSRFSKFRDFCGALT
jgi:hypothetical protein